MPSEEAVRLFELFDVNHADRLNYTDIPTTLFQLLSDENLTSDEIMTLENFRDDFFDESERLVRMLTRQDTDKDGRITSEQFLSAMTRFGLLVNEEHLTSVFAAIDFRDTGTVGINDVRDYFMRCVWKGE